MDKAEPGSAWTLTRSDSDGHWYYRRVDGAEVWRSDDYYYSNPVNPRCRLWEAAGPGTGAYLVQALRTDRRSRGAQRRRFGTAQAAMAAVDIAIPLGNATDTP
jgi:hypothetical protein